MDSGSDANGDGVADILIHEHYGHFYTETGSYGEAVYLIHGPVTGESDIETDADGIFVNGTDSALSYPTFIGDTDADGLPEIVMAHYWATIKKHGGHGSAAGGAIFVLSGSADVGTTSTDDANTVIRGTEGVAYFGSDVAPAGDTNADGYDDFLVAAYKYDGSGTDRGAAYLFLGPLTSGEIAATSADVILEGETDGDQTGASLSGAGDLNADGRSDVTIGAYSTILQAGTTYLFYGPISGTRTLADSDAYIAGDPKNKANYQNAIDYSANHGTIIQDTNGDGFDDLMFSANLDAEGGKLAGAAWLFLGG